MVLCVTEPKSIEQAVDLRRAAACLPTDAVLFFSDGSKMDVHRFLLIASSEYWACCFTARMKEGINHVVSFDSNVDAGAAKAILNYVYYGETVVDDIAETLAVAHLWVMPHFLKNIEPLVKKGICSENAIKIFSIAHLRDIDLYKDCVNWVVDHFDDFAPQDLPPVLYGLLLQKPRFKKECLQSLKHTLLYFDLVEMATSDKDFILKQFNWDWVARSGEEGVNHMKKLLNHDLPSSVAETIRLALDQRHNPADTKALYGGGDILPYADLRKGMNVVIMNDAEQLKSLCLVPAPQAKHCAGWAHNTANLCGLVVEVEGFEESLRAIKFRRGFSEHIIPFNAIAVLGYPAVVG